VVQRNAETCAVRACITAGHYPNPLGRSNPAAAGHEDLSGRLGGSPEYSVSVVDYNQPAARSARVSLRGAEAQGAAEGAAAAGGRHIRGRSTLMGGSDDALMGSKRGMKRGLAAEDVHEGQFNMEKAFKDLGAYVEDHPEFITAVCLIFSFSRLPRSSPSHARANPDASFRSSGWSGAPQANRHALWWWWGGGGAA